MVVGRHTNNDIIIDDPAVSRQHALIIETPRGIALRDLHSRNGTYLNDRGIGDKERLLKHGDRIRLAASKVSLVVRQETAGPAESNADSPGREREPAAFRPRAESLASR
jgi:pSer/pThr/pTyr-binding forkhead associated (FHA) protein